MILELTISKIIQLVLCAIMLFSWGLKIDASEEARRAAKDVYFISLILIWIFILCGV